MTLDRLHRDPERSRDLPGPKTLADELQHLQVTIRQLPSRACVLGWADGLT